MAKQKAPIHPGRILLEDFLEPLGVTQTKLCIAIAVEPRRISEIINGKRSITPDTALRLGRFLSTGPELWLNLQQEYDLRIARRKLKGELQHIKPVQDPQNAVA